MHQPPIPHLAAEDPEIAGLIEDEARRQHDKIRLIPSENYVSHAVLEASGTVLTNKYSEGYPGKRYYEGQQFIDPLETLAIERAKALFGAEHANVQPYSGSPANLAVYLAFLKPGDTVMGLALPIGGHLTHGWRVSITGKCFQRRAVRRAPGHRPHRPRRGPRPRARTERPKLIFCGGTALPAHHATSPAFAAIANEVGAVLRRGHRAHRRPDRRRRAPVAGRPRRRGHHDHAQDPARPARRDDPAPTPSTRRRSTRPSSPACRAARTTTPPPASRSR